MAITVLQHEYIFLWVNTDTSYNTNTMAMTSGVFKARAALAVAWGVKRKLFV